MNSLNIRIESILNKYDLSGKGSFDDTDIEALENAILDCNRDVATHSINSVDESIYDTIWSILKELKPDSDVLSEVWAEDGQIEDYKDLLVKNPMMSIETAKSYTSLELINFLDRMPESASYFASYKINGHGVRWVYKDGNLVSATSRARNSKGRDITRQMGVLLGTRNEYYAEFGLVEVRGEVCLKLDRLKDARGFNPSIKSAFSAVSSLLRDSTSDEELELLDVLCYGVYIDGFTFSDKEEEYQELDQAGFKTPNYLLIENCDKDELAYTIESVVNSFESDYEEFGYFCDGVVFEVNSRETFFEMGTMGNHFNGNIALKVGIWEQTQYTGYINKIIWTRGKTKLSPVALVGSEQGMLIEDDEGKMINYNELGVLTAQGNKVRRVPLYEPKNLIILDAYVGNPVCFKYGGEAGVVPCLPDGRLLKEDASVSIVTGDEWERYQSEIE